MHISPRTLLSLAAACACTSLLLAADGPSQQTPAKAGSKQADPAAQPAGQGLPPLPATPAAITELVEVREFRLTQGYEHRFSKEKPTVKAGYLVVARASSDLLVPRQIEMPVLMVGATVAEPLNVGYASGTVVFIVPSTVNADGSLELDLTVSPIYFAPPMLPEQIDAAFAKQQLGLAERSGVVPQTAAVVTRARQGRAVTELADRDALNVLAGGLVRRYAADETEIADALEGKTDSTPRSVKP